VTINQILQNAIGPQLNIEFPQRDANVDNFGNKTLGNETFDNEQDFYENMFSLNTTETILLLKKISPRCKDYLLKCKWDSQLVNCSDVSI
jgi:hypothetical protein